MYVYVAFYEVRHEGLALLGIYADYQQALDRCMRHANENVGPSDRWTVYRCVLGDDINYDAPALATLQWSDRPYTDERPAHLNITIENR